MFAAVQEQTTMGKPLEPVPPPPDDLDMQMDVVNISMQLARDGLSSPIATPICSEINLEHSLTCIHPFSC